MDGSGRGSGWTVIYDRSSNGSSRQSSSATGTQKTEAIGSPKQNAGKIGGDNKSNNSRLAEIEKHLDSVSTPETDEAIVQAEVGFSETSSELTASKGRARAASTNMQQPLINASVNRLINQIQAIDPSFRYSTARPSFGLGSQYNQRDVSSLTDTLARMRQESGGWTVTSRIKDAGLPNSGPIRYIPPRNYKASMTLPRGPGKGFVDRFGNEWIRGPSRTRGQSYEWDVQLSPRGREQMGRWSIDGQHLNVSLDGTITH